MRSSDAFAEAALMLLAVLLAFAGFAVLPPVDLWVSGLFYTPGHGWAWAGRVSEDVRAVQWGLSILLGVVAAAALLRRAVTRRDSFGVPWRVWAFVLALYALASGVLANGLLKSHWGRARPASITEFGGAAEFTLPHQIADQCLRNCSFVSGEVTAAVAFAVCVLVVVSHLRSPPWTTGPLVVLALAFPVVNAVQRIASGRHFLTDALFAALFTLIIARLLWRAFGLAKPAIPRS